MTSRRLGRQPARARGLPPTESRANVGKFQKGQSGNPRGKIPGTPNRATVEVRGACAALVEDPTYRARLKARLVAGDLAPAVEAMLWHYAYGKPKEHVQLEGAGLVGLILAAARVGEGPDAG